MPFKNIDIEKVLPDKEVHWKLIFCPKRKSEKNEYRMSIELDDRKRQYMCVSFDELYELLVKIPIEKRCFYEHISYNDNVKFYLDYECYKIDENKRINLKTSLLCLQELFINVIQVLSCDYNISMKDIVLLESSSNNKESYHLILDHPNIRFINNQSIHLLIQEVLRILLLATIQHKCSRNKNHTSQKLNEQYHLSEIINCFYSVWIDWFDCINCKINDTTFTVSNICNLLVYSPLKFFVPCIDLKVYGLERDFRMFTCTKRGENRPLKPCMIFENLSNTNFDSSTSVLNFQLFKTKKETFLILVSNSNIVSTKEILQKSLITELKPINENCINFNRLDLWAKLIGYSGIIKRENFSKIENAKRRKSSNEIANTKMFKSNYEMVAENCTKAYLKSLKSNGFIHSLHTGKHAQFIMCNIRNMNICEESHDDYLNDTTIYFNLQEKQYSARCNRSPCNKKKWMWNPMN